MSVLAKRVVLGALTGIGLVVLVVGAWFTYHLGSSGSATFTARPRAGLVVLEPSVLNRVDDPVHVTATTAGGSTVWIGRATPSDAAAVVGDAQRTEVTGLRLRSWSLDSSTSGPGAPTADLTRADVWRQAVSGRGTARVEVDQGEAPEALVVTAPEGGSITSLRVTVERTSWFFQALLATLLGFLAAVVGAVGLAAGPLRQRLRGTPEPVQPPTETEVAA